MLLQSLLRPVLTPLMRGMFDAPIASSTEWSPLALWPLGASSPGMWIDGPSYPASCFQDSAGTTPLSTVGTVLDSSNPVGLVLDRKAGATAPANPGIHLSQSTSPARPVASARVNQAVDSNNVYGAEWSPSTGDTVARNALVQGGVTLSLVTPTTTSNAKGTYLSFPAYSTLSLYVKANGYRYVQIYDAGGASLGLLVFDTQAGAFSKNSTGRTVTVLNLGSGLFRISVVPGNAVTISLGISVCISGTPGSGYGNYAQTGDGVSGMYMGSIQINLGSTALPYQRVNTDSDYDATGITPFQLYDGVDDGMATASFAAGTLTSAMDCMIAVRRDSGANCVAGLYNGVADATKFFGMAESASGSGCVGSGAGAPTVWVDNTQLTGGTAVTRGTLHTALTVGDWHILEFRNLDLSTWTAAGFGLYTSYTLTGARGDIMLFPYTASTEDKDAARQWLADYYGVTLP